VQPALVALAGLALVAPIPPGMVERYYAGSIYPVMQAALTAWSNRTAYALFDALLAASVLVLAAAWLVWIRRVFRDRSLRPLIAGATRTIVLAAFGYLWFLVAWGLNYDRLPLERVVPYDAARVTPDALRSIAERATRAVNRLYTPGRAQGFPAPDAMPAALVTALHEVERKLGRPRATTPSRPKRTVLGLYFRAAGVDGMHAPFLLETLLNPDLTPPERPAVLAHEWAHLSGHGDEADASFIGLLAALQADDASRYSAWLAVFHEVVALLPRDEQVHWIARLEDGPAADRRAIAARQRRRIEAVSRASWLAYDRYLKAHGVREGVQSYSRVVQLLLGSGALDEIPPASGAPSER
jgi:hypothetical protein